MSEPPVIAFIPAPLAKLSLNLGVFLHYILIPDHISAIAGNVSVIRFIHRI